MKNVLFLIIAFINFSLVAQESTFEIKGNVTDFENQALAGTNILI